MYSIIETGPFGLDTPLLQWPCNRNRLIGGAYPVSKAYVSRLWKGISQENMALYGTGTPFLDPGIPIKF